ncbi:Hint domain-containing protein [Roseisalinus antarcticus]|uniref:Hedgehog/Intein (Hint) domain-containing protein n=1 Tax=Roseisalinus antarcticus TaxID=254357 RepID=A0A1Y5T3V8_9RHOB|nr:Hint domain-containing protein [Roseisalinus antarcticus]SLN54765.1 hypothetical protein ROA7023_02470 [Roseisalinus antarcticus]
MDSRVKPDAERVGGNNRMGSGGRTAGRTGLCAGTDVLTLEGSMPVDHLAPGDRIITRDTGMAVLRELRCLRTRYIPVTFRAGSLGHTRPDRDTTLPDGTLVHVRDWRARALFGAPTATVPAARLVDGEFVSSGAPITGRLYQLVFDTAHILYADGLEIAAGIDPDQPG